MKIHTIAALSIPLVLLACSGAGSSADLTEPQSTGPRAPDLSQPAPTRPASASADPLEPTGPAGTAALDAQQLLQAQVASAALTLDDATDIALAANPGSQVLEADLDGDGASPRYEVELRLADGQVVEVRVDAVTGEILATVPEDADDDNDDDDDDGDDDVAIDCSGAISAVEAQAVAEAEAGGTAVEVEIDDGCQFEVTVETATGFVEVDVAQDGTVQKVENDDGPGDADDDDGPDDDDDDDDDDGDDD